MSVMLYFPIHRVHFRNCDQVQFHRVFRGSLSAHWKRDHEMRSPTQDAVATSCGAHSCVKPITKGEAHTPSPNPSTAGRTAIDETPQTAVADRDKKSLAILPFRNLSNDASKSFYEFSLAGGVH